LAAQWAEETGLMGSRVSTEFLHEGESVMAMEPADYLDWLCEQLAYEWTRLPVARGISKNNALYGAYVEGMVRDFIKRSVAPLRVSTGTILHEKNVGELGPQLDAMI